jgi:hypothetical protein
MSASEIAVFLNNLSGILPPSQGHSIGALGLVQMQVGHFDGWWTAGPPNKERQEYDSRSDDTKCKVTLTFAALFALITCRATASASAGL